MEQEIIGEAPVTYMASVLREGDVFPNEILLENLYNGQPLTLIENGRPTSLPEADKYYFGDKIKVMGTEPLNLTRMLKDKKYTP